MAPLLLKTLISLMMSEYNKPLKIPHLILIAGQNQNVGKTTLACQIIRNFSRKYKITAFKVSPHFHKNTGNAKTISKGEDWQILEETSFDSKKDTSRMLQAGAEKAFLLQAEENALYNGLIELLKFVPAGNLIICESAGVREFIEPGVFLMLRQLICTVCSIDDEKLMQQADRIVTFTVNGFDFSINDLKIVNQKWMLKKT